MKEFLKTLLEGVVIPVATAVVAAWWKGLSKPEQASGEDRLLAFEHLVAAAALVMIQFFQVWVNPKGTKNEIAWHAVLFAVVFFVTLGFASSVKNQVFARSKTYYMTEFKDPSKRFPVYQIDKSDAVNLSTATAVFLLAVFLVDRFIVVLT